MAKLVDLNLNPEPRTLRQFGFIALVAFGLLAAAAYTESFLFSFGLGSARLAVTGVLLALAVICLLFSLIAPKANRPIYVALTLITYPIGIVMSYVIMALLFFGIIGPTSLVLRLIGKDPLQRRYDRNAQSYWTVSRGTRSKQTYLRQY
jgi:hypothetical protein